MTFFFFFFNTCLETSLTGMANDVLIIQKYRYVVISHELIQLKIRY